MDEMSKDKEGEFREFVESLKGEVELSQMLQAQNIARAGIDDPDHEPLALLDAEVQGIADRLTSFYRSGVQPALLDAILAPYEETERAPKDFDDYIESLPITAAEKSLLRTIRDQKQKGVLRVEVGQDRPGDLVVTHNNSQDIVIPADIETAEEPIISANLFDKIRRAVGSGIPSRLKFSFKPLDIMAAAETKGPDTFFEILDQKHAYARALEELRRAGIPSVANEAQVEPEKFSSKKVLGKIGEYECLRARRYWVINGSIPLSLAQELYKNPIGGKYVRFRGYANGIEPEEALFKIPEGYVTNKQGEPIILGGCHIDTQEGLNLFSKMVAMQLQPRLRRIK